MMRVQISTVLECPTERAWQEVQTSRLLCHIATPLVLFEAIVPTALPENWSDDKYQVRMWLFGFIPFANQWIVIQRGSVPGKYELLDDGYGDMIQTWRHLITLRPTPEGFTRYTDTVDIDAGFLTFGVWLFANIFFRYRQSRWRGLVKRNFWYAET